MSQLNSILADARTPLQPVDDARTDVLRVYRGHGFFVPSRLHAHAGVGTQVDVRATSRPDDCLNRELVVDQIVLLQGAVEFSLESRAARAGEEIFNVELRAGRLGQLVKTTVVDFQDRYAESLGHTHGNGDIATLAVKAFTGFTTDGHLVFVEQQA